MKADGYGHGETEVARAAFEAGAKIVSVATPDEAVRLRMAGISGDILVMGPSPVSFAEKAAALNITISVSDATWLQEAIDKNERFENPLKIHVKIDSGMGRIGLRDAEELQFLMSLRKVRNKLCLMAFSLILLALMKKIPKKTEVQFAMFKELVDTLPEKPRLVHVSNSAATILYPEYALDAVRFGIGLYGIALSEFVGRKMPFELKGF